MARGMTKMSARPRRQKPITRTPARASNGRFTTPPLTWWRKALLKLFRMVHR